MRIAYGSDCTTITKYCEYIVIGLETWAWGRGEGEIGLWYFLFFVMVTRQQNLRLPIFRCVIKWLQENTVRNGSALPDRHFLLSMAFSLLRCRSQIYCGGSFCILLSWRRTRGHTVLCGNSTGYMSYNGVAELQQCHFSSNLKHIIPDITVIIVSAVCVRTR